MFKLRHILFGFIFALSVMLMTQTSSPIYAAEGCSLNASGNGDTDVFFNNVHALEGDTITIVVTAAPGAGNGVAITTLNYISKSVGNGGFTTPTVLSYTFPRDTTFNLQIEWEYLGEPENTYSISCSSSEDGAGPLAANLLDGRLNNEQGKDVAAPVAVYCADGNIDVYKIDAETGDGTRIISVAQVEGSPESTQLLASAEGVSLYWLDTGEYHINTTNFEGKPYWINWVGCSSDALTHTLN